MKLKIINELKSIYRECSVDSRKESSAEHSWSSLVLADYFMEEGIDKTKVYDLLIYHDMVEIESGDTPITEKKDKEKEMEGARRLKERLPETLAERFWNNFMEFEEQKSKEARFAKAIDAIDAVIQELDHKEDWKGWTKDYLLDKKIKHIKEFPKIHEYFNGLLEYMEKENYFS